VAAVPEAEDDRKFVRQIAEGHELGTVLLLDFLGVTSKERSLSLLRERAVAALRSASEWQRGDFRFEPAAEPLKDRLSIDLSFAHVRAADR
jgi:hypothetical protein